METPPSKLRVWALAARPKTLPAAAAPVLIGTAMAWEADAFHAIAFVMCLLGALLIQIGTNYANDYFDHVKGVDDDERLGPLRVTQAGLVALNANGALDRAVESAVQAAVAKSVELSG